MRDLYQSFPGRSVAPDSDYPSGSARNVTFQGDGTGTPWVAVIANDIQGFFQRCLAAAGLTADNDTETARASQVHAGIRLTSGLPGVIIEHCWSTIPTGVRVINLEGQMIDISPTGEYADLAAAVYVGDSNNATAEAFYKTSDSGGSNRTPSGLYMKTPNARGKFLRVIDPVGGSDPGGDRLPGKMQDTAMLRHYHTVRDTNLKTGTTDIGYSGSVEAASGTGVPKVIFEDGTAEVVAPIYASEEIASSSLTVDPDHIENSETRPVNMAVHVGIWY